MITIQNKIAKICDELGVSIDKCIEILEKLLPVLKILFLSDNFLYIPNATVIIKESLDRKGYRKREISLYVPIKYFEYFNKLRDKKHVKILLLL